MEAIIYSSIASLKIGIFFSVLVYALLLNLPLKKNKGIKWLNLMAVSFILIALGEYAYVFSLIDSDFAIAQVFSDHEQIHLFADALYFVAALGVIMFFRHVNSNVKEYV